MAKLKKVIVSASVVVAGAVGYKLGEFLGESYTDYALHPKDSLIGPVRDVARYGFMIVGATLPVVLWEIHDLGVVRHSTRVEDLPMPTPANLYQLDDYRKD